MAVATKTKKTKATRNTSKTSTKAPTPSKPAKASAAKSKDNQARKSDLKALTPVIFGELQTAYDKLNDGLFNGRLPPCVLTMVRKPRSRGYFSPKRWTGGKGLVAHEIALNPDHIRERSVVEVLSTIAHEMCHLAAEIDGTAPKRVYHNADFRDRMEGIGLITSDTGEPGGKRVGVSMTHYIQSGGRFEKLAKGLSKQLKFTWSSMPVLEPTNGKKSGQRTKYECGSCDAAVWGKADLEITCTGCDEQMEPV